MVEATHRPAWVEVDLDAITENVAALVGTMAPAAVCAVVKADGYGHGAVPVARAAVVGGATWLAVAVVDEAVELREAGLTVPILVLSEPPPPAAALAVAQRVAVVAYTEAGLRAVEAASATAGRETAIHLKVDTGMGRVGARGADAPALAAAIQASRWLRLDGLMTHLAVADELDRAETTIAQIDHFESVRDALTRAGTMAPLLHAANSAGALAHPSARYDLVRCGIAIYGYPPVPLPAGCPPLRPALSLRAEVSMVKEVPAETPLSYGHRYAPAEGTIIATVPIGYADGVRRALSAAGGQVLIGGRPRPMAGTVTMDQLLVDCGPGAHVQVGDEVVLLGQQGGRSISAEDWAARLGTISYEVLCGLGPRLPRRYRHAEHGGML